MADSDAVRSRRKRRHAAGDHGMCGPSCDRRPPGRVLATAAVAQAGPCTDPAAALAALAARLEAAHEADPADAAVARVLKDTLVVLAGLDGGEDDGDPLAGLRALADPVS